MLDMYIQRPEGVKEAPGAKMALKTTSSTAGPMAMELDSLMQTHCMVPIPEWRAYMQDKIAREQGATSTFAGQR